MLGRERAIVGDHRSTAADGVCHSHEGLHQLWRGDERRSRSHVRRRATIEEDVGAGREAVTAGLLGEQTHRRQRIAENADASLGSAAAGSERGARVLAFADGGEEVEVDRGLERPGALVGGEGGEERRDRYFHFRIRLLSLRRRFL
jgi:hypothetical protein